jgi:hypothetical protein
MSRCELTDGFCPGDRRFCMLTADCCWRRKARSVLAGGFRTPRVRASRFTFCADQLYFRAREFNSPRRLVCAPGRAVQMPWSVRAVRKSPVAMCRSVGDGPRCARATAGCAAFVCGSVRAIPRRAGDASGSARAAPRSAHCVCRRAARMLLSGVNICRSPVGMCRSVA